MWNKTHVKEVVLLSVFLLAAFGIGISSTILNNQGRNTTSTFAATDFDQYCRDGVYYVKSPKDGSEITCGRAPNCDDTSYGDTANIAWRSNGQCWVEDYWGGDRCKAYCAGYVPLCCYKMAESGNAEDCPQPERKYCMRDQCKPVQNQDSSCGSNQGFYCIDVDHCVEHRSQIPKLSLEDRLAGRSAPLNSPTPDAEPTNTPASQPPTSTPTSVPTNQPVATATPTSGSNNPTTPTATNVPQPTGNSGGNNTPTTGVTQFPIAIPTATPTRVITANNSNSLNNNSGNNSNTANTNIPRPTDTAALPNLQIPTIQVGLPNLALKNPNEIIQETVNEEQINKLNRATDPPLNAARNTFVAIKSYDQQLENTVKNWIIYLRIQITNILQ